MENNHTDKLECNTSFKEEYGDWQTNLGLALLTCRILKEKGVSPKVLLEPTCGIGNFIIAALMTFDTIEDVYGIEINKSYVEQLKARIESLQAEGKIKVDVKIHLYNSNFFDFNFKDIKNSLNGRMLIILGNPPWVTNSKLSCMESNNIPTKSNFKKEKGLNAITGKGNFDIAEYICTKLIKDFYNENAVLAMLVKNSVIKNLIYEQKKETMPLSDITQYCFDSKKEFSVSVAASLICANICKPASCICSVKDMYSLEHLHSYGWIGNKFVANIDNYNDSFNEIDGCSQLTWWSGVKHDCSRIMELTINNEGKYVNGLGEIADIEEICVYPLIKSSDIKEEIISKVRKYVIITQHYTSEETSNLKNTAPKTYKYLMDHANMLDNRGSSIYKKRPRFCIFGIGKYSFEKYKIVVSSLYKQIKFSMVVPIKEKPVMLDDTCYLLSFDNYEDAKTTLQILNDHDVLNFINSLASPDAKRIINKDILMRIDLLAIIKNKINSSTKISESEYLRYYNFLKSKSQPIQKDLFSA